MKEFHSNLGKDLADLKMARIIWSEHSQQFAQSRIGHYERELEKLIELGKDNRQKMTDEARTKSMLLLSEVQEFLFVSRTAHTSARLRNTNNFGDIFAGPPLQTGETDSKLAHPRDIFFEYFVASALEAAGVPVTFEPYSDLYIQFCGVPIHLECKRPQSEKKSETAIRKAAVQLSRGRTENSLGIVVMGIGKLLSAGRKIFLAENYEDLTKQLHNATAWYAQETERYWISKKTVSAVLVWLNCPVVVKSSRKLSHSTTLLMVVRGDLPQHTHALLSNLTDKLQSGFPGAASDEIV